MHGCRSNFPDRLRPLKLFFLDALLPLCVGGSEDGAVFGVGFATLLFIVPGNYTCLSFLLSMDSKLPVTFQHHVDTLRFVTTAPVSILSFLGVKVSQSEFLISASLHHRFQFFDRHASMFSDEFPCPKTLKQFFVDKTHVFLTWYKLSRTSSGGILVIEKIHPISCRIPERRRCEE